MLRIRKTQRSGTRLLAVLAVSLAALAGSAGVAQGKNPNGATVTPGISITSFFSGITYTCNQVVNKNHTIYSWDPDPTGIDALIFIDPCRL